MPIPIKTPAEIEQLQQAASQLRSVLESTITQVRPGMTTRDIELCIEPHLNSAGLHPVLRGYRQHNTPPFPGVCCICINSEIVHAPPGHRIVREGDVVTIDIAARSNASGWHADIARSFAMPDTGSATRGRAARIVDACDQITQRVIESLAPGVRWHTIVEQARSHARSLDVSLVTTYCGHGIGTALHEPPRLDWIVRSDRPDEDVVLRPGMVLTVEPVVVEGAADPSPLVLDDGWTVIESAHRWSAHREHMIAITQSGARILA